MFHVTQVVVELAGVSNRKARREKPFTLLHLSTTILSLKYQDKVTAFPDKENLWDIGIFWTFPGY